MIWSFYGKYKAKLSDELWEKVKDRARTGNWCW